MPLRSRRPLAASIHVELLRSLLGDNIAISARRERDLRLTLVEAVIRLVQRVGQALHLAAGVQLLPGVAAGVAVARLQDHHEGVQTRDNLVNAAVGDLEVCVVIGVGGDVDGLVRVVLQVEEFLFVGAPDRVVDVVGVADQAQGLVGVVRVLHAWPLGHVAEVAVDTLGDRLLK